MNLMKFIEYSNRSDNIDELTNTFLLFLKNFGIERFIMGDLSHDSVEKKEEHMGILVNYPEEWLNHYVENHYVEHDPVYQKALVSCKPYTWKDVQKSDISEKAQQVMDEAGECNLYNGIGLALHRPYGQIIGMGFAGSEKDARCDKDAVSTIHAAANQFFIAYLALSKKDDFFEEIKISVREKEILLWLSRGKTKSEIADILYVTESTVKRHCENVFKKLNVNNIPFAVLKALRMGLIKPY